jgi:hypothetical protein
MLPVWAMIPREASGACERIFYQAIETDGLQRMVGTRKTVNYDCKSALAYHLAREIPGLSQSERLEINLRIRADIWCRADA